MTTTSGLRLYGKRTLREVVNETVCIKGADRRHQGCFVTVLGQNVGNFNDLGAAQRYASLFREELEKLILEITD